MFDTRLITFITLAKTKNFTKTAEILNITQPAVSQQIKYLEEYYGVNFLRKEGKRLDLTEEGRLFLEYAREIENLSKKIELTFKNNASLIKKYNIGATLTIGAYVMPDLLGEYKKLHPNIDVILHVYNTKDMIKKILNRELNLAIIEGLFNKKVLKYIKLKDDELILVVSPKHEFARRKEVAIKDVLNGKLILREHGSGTRRIFENAVIQKGYNSGDINVYMEIGDISAIKSLVESNLGYTVISKEAVKNEMDRGTLIQVPIKNLSIKREFNLVFLGDTDMSFVNQFTKFCCEFCK